MTRVNYHGGGYVGLTGAVHYYNAGYNVVITDPDLDVVNAINKRTPKAGSFLHYTTMPPLHEGDRMFMAQPIPDLSADAHIIAVPSERNDSPFMEIVFGVFNTLDGRAHPQIPIIIESTVMPGVAKKLRALAKRHGHGERPWAIAPRRDWFADKDKNLTTLTRIVGRDEEHHLAIEPWITSVCRDIQWTSPETAEVTKALENALLHLPVALLHELALNYPDYDIAEAARLASSHWRFKSMGPLYLGLGTGGRCVPLGPRYLERRGGALLQTAIAIDTDFAHEAIRTLALRSWTDFASKNKEAVVLGLAYRPGFKDAGCSSGLRAVDSLATLCRKVTVVDPHFTTAEIHTMIHRPPEQRAWVDDGSTTFVAQEIGPGLLDALGQADIVVLTVGHDQFKEMAGSLDWLRRGTIVLDAAGIWEAAAAHNAAIVYRRPGRPGWLAEG